MASSIDELRKGRNDVVETTVANPYETARVVATPETRTGLISVEQQRAIAEVQARMLIARANPRDPVRAVDAILNECTRPSLAESSTYNYTKGGTAITGPSIRLIEAVARRWGNIASGIKELSRGSGYSECVAYAWDLETGYYDERQFQVRHWIDTKKGGRSTSDEREIYELIANFGQRRKRAVLMAVIGGEIIEAALQQCQKTLMAHADTSPDGLKKLVAAFAEIGVSREMIEKRIQRRIESILPAQIVQLRTVYTSIKDGIAPVSEYFEVKSEESAIDKLRTKPEKFGKTQTVNTETGEIMTPVTGSASDESSFGNEE